MHKQGFYTDALQEWYTPYKLTNCPLVPSNEYYPACKWNKIELLLNGDENF